MALDIPKLRKLVSLDPNDPLSRFALGKKLFESDDSSAARHAYGMMGIRERAELIGAHLNVTSLPGKGTAVEVVVPR